MDAIDLASLRTDYSREALDESSVAESPFQQFVHWMGEAFDVQLIEPNAMTLSTVGPDCRPLSRIVLLKGFDPEGFTFFTNYESKKGRDLAANPHCSLHFFWAGLERQVIVSGTAGKVSREESAAYFSTRPLESRIGAWASNQSSRIAGREQLERRFEDLRAEFDGKEIPLPPFWGGYRVVPDRFEFWQGRPSRLHDRICYELNDEGVWQIYRLAP